MVRWALFLLPGRDENIIVVVVDDSDDDELAGVVAREELVPSPRFSGLWGTGQRDGNWLIGFYLTQLGGGVKRQWFTDNIHRPLLEAILEVPHLVAIMPTEIAGEATTLDAMLPRLGGAVILRVQHESPEVAQVLAEREDG
jgi:hypothetical protein